VVLRSNIDPNEVLRHLTTKTYLGNFDKKHQETIPTRDKEAFEDEVESHSNTVPQLFFLLPNGVKEDMKEWALKARKRWSSWKCAYETVYGPGSCIQDDEVLEIFEGYIDNEADE
jgi:DNA-binding SARP family transcriptional activator